MQKSEEEIIKIFKDTGALLEGHFILRSGLRSAYFFQCAQVCQHLDKVTRLAELLIKNISKYQTTTVVGNAMGGLVIGQEVARLMKNRFIFLEKVNDKLELRRNFKFKNNEKVLIMEDVITRGGRVFEAIQCIKKNGGRPVVIGTIVDRSKSMVDFKIPLHSLASLNFPTYKPEEIPKELKAIPPVKPGS